MNAITAFEAYHRMEMAALSPAWKRQAMAAKRALEPLVGHLLYAKLRGNKDKS